ncbi:hypothetical protein [Intestinibacter bartlettii]|uniref:hypothetical protein n=1 Tax=Intestinibacter bartlettii TaxID=261299 RepID=UPI00319E8F3B
MLKQKEPVVFEPKNLESLIQGLDKKDITEDTYFSNFEYEFISHTGGSLFMNKNYFLKDPEKYIKPMQVEINTAIDRNGHVLTRIVDLFMEFATKNLSITKKQIQDRKVEFI